ncbi:MULTISPECIES: SMI1/KNR4 family protein [unclassified Olleya]|jgi:hypothetical protein|uniref:SMI1/KNR4 family protein n=1 Tax=unclassified Olleya TaxID=2615019 RepID=UPI0011A70F56|nr:SMI1/KNR4 family protein [Olleya sp. Hel_I_94]TVZ47460.1 SMI1/KNR4 family protein SUKH-1 [Olleya sp. Hel_I_94]
MNELNQIERIKIKLEKVLIIDSEYQEFGVSSHKYQINKPATEKEIEEFEIKYGIELPTGYKQFLLEVGNGGLEYEDNGNLKPSAGPFYGIYELFDSAEIFTESSTLRKDVFFNSKITESDWRSITWDKFDIISDEEFEQLYNKLLSGIMIISYGGCSNYQGLILNGKDKGKVIYVYDEIEYKPHIAEEGYFLDWYESWLDKIIEKNKNGTPY